MKLIEIIAYHQFKNKINNLKIALESYKDFISNIGSVLIYHILKRVKFYFICCNLRPETKFFEYQESHSEINYNNPSSGMVIDETITDSRKYEFYIQPQFVNLGTATPCHFQVMYYDQDSENEQNKMTLYDIERLTYNCCYYYWNWSGAVRLPAIVKLASKGLDYVSNILQGKLVEGNNQFSNIFIYKYKRKYC